MNSPDGSPRPALRPALHLAIIHAGIVAADTLTGSMLPITARVFTDNIALIGVMLALNRLFGFLVQPYVAWRSDHVRTPAGRRRPYLLWGLPATFTCLLLLGFLPEWIPADAHGLAASIALLFFVNLVFQAMVDVNYGAIDPLYGDTFAPSRLGFAVAWRGYAGLVVGIVMSYLLLPLADRFTFAPYVGGAGFVALAWFAALRLREDPATPLSPKTHYKPWTPLLGLRDPAVARVAVISSCVLGTQAVGGMLSSLFITETLGLSLADLGYLGGVGIVIGLLLNHPGGRCVDRYGSRAVLGVAFALSLFAFLGGALFVQGRVGLYLTAALGAAGGTLGWVATPALLYTHATPARRGEIFGTVQATRAAAATVLTLLGGQLAHLTGSYRACLWLAAALALVGFIAAWPVNPAKRRATTG